MDRQDVIILGAGGHSKGVVETITAQGVYHILGLTAPASPTNLNNVLGYPILGDDTLIPHMMASGLERFIIGLGSIGNNAPRADLYRLGLNVGLSSISAIHPAAHVSESADIGTGTVVFSGAIIAAQCSVGQNVIVNHGAIIEHDCVIGDHVHVATGACIAGTVHVGNSAHIGAGATILQDIRIGEYAIVAAGAVVVRDVDAGSTVFGVPAAMR